MLWLASSYYSRKKMAFHATLQEAQLLNPPGLRLGGYNKEKRSLKIKKKKRTKPKPLRIHYDMNTVTVSSVSSCQEGLWTVHLFTFLQSCITLVTYHCITRVPRPRPHLVIFGDRIIFARMRLRVSQIQMSSPRSLTPMSDYVERPVPCTTNNPPLPIKFASPIAQQFQICRPCCPASKLE